MNVDPHGDRALSVMAHGREARAEDILRPWLPHMPIDIDPADAARVVLLDVPARQGETRLQQRLRGRLVELSRGPGPAAPHRRARSAAA